MNEQNEALIHKQVVLQYGARSGLKVTYCEAERVVWHYHHRWAKVTCEECKKYLDRKKSTDRMIELKQKYREQMKERAKLLKSKRIGEI